MLFDASDAVAIARAATVLEAGELVAFPTETVYGLGARADVDAAVAKIFAAKGRPAEHPLIVHVADASGVAAFAAAPPAAALRLIAAFWPGPMTVILRRLAGRAELAAGGHDTIGLRCPSHPVAQALLAAARGLGVPGLAAPSANRFGRISPTLAAHVVAGFDPSLMVLDGGACPLGIESCIVDCSRVPPRLLRPGVIPRERIEAVLGEPLRNSDAAAARAPGTLASHYAPRARLRLMPAAMLDTALQALGVPALKLAVYSRSLDPAKSPGVLHRRMPAAPEQAAHELFSILHELDAEGVRIIWVEEPPAGPDWDGVRDRLQRAAAA